MTHQGRCTDVATIREILRSYQAIGGIKATARALSCAKGTVREYVRWAQSEGFLSGDLPDEAHLAGAWVKRRKLKPTLANALEPLRETLQDWNHQGISLVRIQEMLVERHGWTGGYDALKRYTQSFRHPTPAFLRLETQPAEEAQVDFGYFGMVWDETQKRQRKCWVFVMTLSYSRHMYAEAVFSQDLSTWIGCHRRAFDFLGGVPKKLVIDNLKTAIVKAALYDTLAHRTYEEMASHYGFVITPCRVATPRHKGKVERGVGYVKGSFWAGRTFRDLVDVNRQLKGWVMDHAGLRDHGTTRRQPLKVFEAEEKTVLLPLPLQPFHMTRWKQAKVHTDCHVSVDGAYYSVPHRFCGQEVLVRLTDSMVDVFVDHQVVASHIRSYRKGMRTTVRDHYPPSKVAYLEESPQWCLREAEQTGPSTHEFIRHLLNQSHPLDYLRRAQGILRLKRTFGRERLEAACQRASAHGVYTYQVVKNILQKKLDISKQDTGEVAVSRNQKTFAFARPIEDFLDEAANTK